MPTQKDLKRIVRARMHKTGQSYTAARLQLIRTQRPVPGYAETAGMSDAAVKKATGRDWIDWVKILDAAERPHREIAKYVSSIGTSDWWSQMVTVGYERIRGLRDRGQRRGGAYEANKSRTFQVPVSRLFDVFAKPRVRVRWLPGRITVRTADPHRNTRMSMSMEDGTLVHLGFTSKGESKSTVAIRHSKLADRSAAENSKAWWPTDSMRSLIFSISDLAAP
jgi:hypothetical protein